MTDDHQAFREALNPEFDINALSRIACRYENVDCMRLLIELGAAPDAPNPKGTTPLMYVKTAAFGFGQMDVINILLGVGANPSAQDQAKLTDWIIPANGRVFDLIFTERGSKSMKIYIFTYDIEHRKTMLG